MQIFGIFFVTHVLCTEQVNRTKIKHKISLFDFKNYSNVAQSQIGRILKH